MNEATQTISALSTLKFPKHSSVNARVTLLDTRLRAASKAVSHVTELTSFHFGCLHCLPFTPLSSPIVNYNYPELQVSDSHSYSDTLPIFSGLQYGEARVERQPPGQSNQRCTTLLPIRGDWPRSSNVVLRRCKQLRSKMHPLMIQSSCSGGRGKMAQRYSDGNTLGIIETSSRRDTTSKTYLYIVCIGRRRLGWTHTKHEDTIDKSCNQ